MLSPSNNPPTHKHPQKLFESLQGRRQWRQGPYLKLDLSDRRESKAAECNQPLPPSRHSFPYIRRSRSSSSFFFALVSDSQHAAARRRRHFGSLTADKASSLEEKICAQRKVHGYTGTRLRTGVGKQSLAYRKVER